MSLERLTLNLAGRVRRQKLEGREHLVAPITLIVPGVLNGSQGPLYYPLEEIRRNPDVWNHVPIVVYHPSRNGRNISARDPDVINTQKVGVVLRSRANGKLQAEAWFDVERTRQIDNRVYESLVKNEPIELSTGLFTRNEPAPEGATYNGTPYTHTARDYRPDHLAVLPDQIGACSLQDGCGVLANGRYDLTLVANVLNTNDNSTVSKEATNMPDEQVTLNEDQRKELIDNLISTCCWEENDRETLNNFSDEKLQLLTENLSRTSESTSTSRHTETMNLEDLSMSDLENEMKRRKELMSRNESAAENSNQPLTDEEWFAQAPEGVQNTLKQAAQIMQGEKDKIIAKLTANLEGADKTLHIERLRRRSLEDLQSDLDLMPRMPVSTQNREGGEGEESQPTGKRTDCDWLTNVLSSVGKHASEEDEPLLPPTINYADGTTSRTGDAADADTMRAMHRDEWIRNAPREVRDMLQNAANVEKREREKLIDEMTANIQDSTRRLSARDFLETKSVEELRYMLEMMGGSKGKKPVANYQGAAAPSSSTPLSNDEKEDILPLPSMTG